MPLFALSAPGAVPVFTDYITIIVNGVAIRCRPLHTTVGGDIVISWQQEVNGVFVSVADRTNPR